MKKLFLIITMTVFLSLTLCGCASKDVEKAELPQNVENDKIQIGMCFDSFVIERWIRDRDVFMTMAKEMGAEVNFQSANGDIEEQIRQIEYFINKKTDIIVIICIDSDSLTDVVGKAKDAGIKVIAYDRLINNADIDLYITFDNERVGTMMGEALVNTGLGEGDSVIMLGGSTADNNVHLVENGFEKVMNENGVKILDKFHADGWKGELAAEYLLENQQLLEEADAIMCGNDNVASAVFPILSEQRLAGVIPMTGQDADLEACQRIVEGTQIMTVYKPVTLLAQKAAECAVLMARNENLDGTEITTIENGEYTIPYLGLEPVCVTADNIDELIINSGFHSKEDVYLNVIK